LGLYFGIKSPLSSLPSLPFYAQETNFGSIQYFGINSLLSALSLPFYAQETNFGSIFWNKKAPSPPYFPFLSTHRKLTLDLYSILE
jgi:hypothetical protein